MDASLVLEDLFSSFRFPPIIQRLNSRWSTIRIFSEGPTLSIGPFQEVQREVIYFPYIVRKNDKPP